MKPGDKVKVFNYKDDTYQIMTVVEVYDYACKLKHPDIGGHFIIAMKHIVRM